MLHTEVGYLRSDHVELLPDAVLFFHALSVQRRQQSTVFNPVTISPLRVEDISACLNFCSSANPSPLVTSTTKAYSNHPQTCNPARVDVHIPWFPPLLFPRLVSTESCHHDRQRHPPG